jgi:hypothetical protein
MTIVRKLARPADGTRPRASASTGPGARMVPALPHQEPGTELRQVDRQDGFPPPRRTTAPRRSVTPPRASASVACLIHSQSGCQ